METYQLFVSKLVPGPDQDILCHNPTTNRVFGFCNVATNRVSQIIFFYNGVLLYGHQQGDGAVLLFSYPEKWAAHRWSAKN
jgi:hypothetical protein